MESHHAVSQDNALAVISSKSADLRSALSPAVMLMPRPFLNTPGAAFGGAPSDSETTASLLSQQEWKGAGLNKRDSSVNSKAANVMALVRPVLPSASDGLKASWYNRMGKTVSE